MDGINLELLIAIFAGIALGNVLKILAYFFSKS